MTHEKERLILRIIAGTCRGRSFEAPEGLSTRPTLDRVKEAVFGSIQFEVAGAVMLDLFSGSGNMGLEAASRGASRVICVDMDAHCTALIEKNARKLGLMPPVEVWCMDYNTALTRLKGLGVQADIVYLDAPYASGLSLLAAERLFREGLVSPYGRVFVEHDIKTIPAPVSGAFQIKRTRRYGTCGVSELEFEKEQS